MFQIYFAARERARRVVKKLHFSKRISRRFVKPKPAVPANEPNGERAANGPIRCQGYRDFLFVDDEEDLIS